MPSLRLRLLAAVLLLAPRTALGDEPAGREIFLTAEPPCGLCHRLADADAEGRIGPDLDRLRPNEQRVQTAVRDGVGAMPAYVDTLSEEEIEAVAAYVAEAAGQAE